MSQEKPGGAKKPQIFLRSAKRGACVCVCVCVCVCPLFGGGIETILGKISGVSEASGSPSGGYELLLRSVKQRIRNSPHKNPIKSQNINSFHEESRFFAQREGVKKGPKKGFKKAPKGLKRP